MTLGPPTDRPRLVDEHAARLVAGMVLVLVGTALAFEQTWLLAVLVYEFGARAFAGHRASGMAQIARRIVVPALGLTPHWAPAPPKRFAQAIGFVASSAALISWQVLGFAPVGRGLLALLGAFAFLEAVLGFCAGCYAFGLLMRKGWIAEEVCEECRVVPRGSGLVS